MIQKGWGRHTAKYLQPLYRRLQDELSTSDFVWCYTRYQHWMQLEVRRLWVVEVPLCHVLRYVYSGVWQELTRLAEFDREGALRPERWRGLFLDEKGALSMIADRRGADVTALLRVPVDRSWVVDNTRFNKGPDCPDAAFEDLPTSACQAKQCRLVWNDPRFGPDPESKT